MDLYTKEKVDHEQIGELLGLRVVALVGRRERIDLGHCPYAFATLFFLSFRPLVSSGGYEGDIVEPLEKMVW